MKGTWIRSLEVIKAHDKAVVYVVNWWENHKGRALVPNVTGDPYGIDLYNEIEYVHVNYRTESGIWKEGPFPYSSLRELVHKIRKYKKLKKDTGKPVYITHTSTDYSTIIISEVDSFNIENIKRVPMPSETSPIEYVPRFVCHSEEFEEYSLPIKKFKKVQTQTDITTFMK